jgi:uncharacterized protein (TIGR03437 family)
VESGGAAIPILSVTPFGSGIFWNVLARTSPFEDTPFVVKVKNVLVSGNPQDFSYTTIHINPAAPPGTYPPTISQGGIVDLVGLRQVLSPGALASIYGLDFTDKLTAATTLPLPTDIDGVQVKVNGRPAPIFAVSQGQLNVQIPWATETGTATVTVARRGKSVSSQVTVAQSAPAILIDYRNGVPFIFRYPNNDRINQGNPAKPGDVLTLFLSGSGVVTNTPADGWPAESSPLSYTVLKPEVSVGGKQAEVLFSGLTPSLVALVQLNVRLPSDLRSGNWALKVRYGDAEDQRTIPVTSQ